jgi:hypothetical protein
MLTHGGSDGLHPNLLSSGPSAPIHRTAIKMQTGQTPSYGRYGATSEISRAPGRKPGASRIGRALHRSPLAAKMFEMLRRAPIAYPPIASGA